MKNEYANMHFVPSGTYWLMLLFSFFALSCTSSKKVHFPAFKAHNDSNIAFPGAEGYGRFTTGGRGGKVLKVINLNDSGPGSFRMAAEANYPRIIVFDISGTIHLSKKISIKGNVTIAGQTAPGDGICIADQTVSLGGNNIIVRYLRFRLGDRFQNGGMIDGNGSDDAFSGFKRNHIIIDHCSFSWSTDEAISIYAGDSTTLQWNLIAEPLNYSYHFEAGDKDYEKHGFGGIWGGIHASFHHNLFAHCNSRTPRFNGIRHTSKEHCDFRNNVIYNWGGNNVYAGEGGEYNVINNYYKPGPSTKRNTLDQFVNPFRRKDIPYGKWYVSGNVMEANETISNDNHLGLKLNEPQPGDFAENVIVKKVMPFEPVTTQSATQAYELVLNNAGCNHPQRDTLDDRIIHNVKESTGSIIDVQGGFPHGTPYDLTILAWPALRSAAPLPDEDQDGIPDEWERRFHLLTDQDDGKEFTMSNDYTNIEMYINSLVQ